MCESASAALPVGKTCDNAASHGGLYPNQVRGRAQKQMFNEVINPVNYTPSFVIMQTAAVRSCGQSPEPVRSRAMDSPQRFTELLSAIAPR